MIYQECVMRVAQKFAGYSLAEADNLRKACGKKIRELMAKERDKFVAGCEAPATARDLGNAAVRHHRAVRRLRLQQEPRLRLRPRRLPDRLPEGALPGRVPRLPAHQRQGQPRQGRGLPRECRAMGIEVLVARRQPCRSSDFAAARPDDAPPDVALPVGQPGRHPVRAVGGAQRRRGPGRPARRASATRTGPFADFYDFVERVDPTGAQQAHRRVADQGRRLRLARPPAQGPAGGLRADHRRHPGRAAASATRA